LSTVLQPRNRYLLGLPTTPDGQHQYYAQLARLKNQLNKKVHGKVSIDSFAAATELAEVSMVRYRELNLVFASGSFARCVVLFLNLILLFLQMHILCLEGQGSSLAVCKILGKPIHRFVWLRVQPAASGDGRLFSPLIPLSFGELLITLGMFVMLVFCASCWCSVHQCSFKSGRAHTVEHKFCYCADFSSTRYDAAYQQ
jgi:hypothetical protein